MRPLYKYAIKMPAPDKRFGALRVRIYSARWFRSAATIGLFWAVLAGKVGRRLVKRVQLLSGGFSSSWFNPQPSPRQCRPVNHWSPLVPATHLSRATVAATRLASLRPSSHHRGCQRSSRLRPGSTYVRRCSQCKPCRRRELQLTSSACGWASSQELTRQVRRPWRCPCSPRTPRN